MHLHRNICIGIYNMHVHSMWLLLSFRDNCLQFNRKLENCTAPIWTILQIHLSSLSYISFAGALFRQQKLLDKSGTFP